MALSWRSNTLLLLLLRLLRQQAVDVLRQSVCRLYSAPRVLAAVWLDAVGPHCHKADVCRDFLADLVYVIDKHNTPATKKYVVLHHFISC